MFRPVILLPVAPSLISISRPARMPIWISYTSAPRIRNAPVLSPAAQRTTIIFLVSVLFPAVNR